MINEVTCGNCEEVLRSLPDDIIDLTVTSPPYDQLRSYKGYDFNFQDIANELYRVTKPGGVLVWVVGDEVINGSESGTSFRQALYFLDVCKFNLHDTMIYRKNGTQFPDPKRYHQCFEYMLVFSKGAPKTVNIIKDRKNTQSGNSKNNRWERQRDGTVKFREGDRINVADFGARWNIWTYNVGWMKTTADKEAFEHPAMFPEKLAEDHIITWTNEGDTVLDPMCGSGTTLKMAVKNERNFVGIDMGEEYCKIARQRVEKAKKELENRNKYKIFF